MNELEFQISQRKAKVISIPDSRIDDEMGTSDVGACASMKPATAADESGRSLDRRSTAPRSLSLFSFSPQQREVRTKTHRDKQGC